ncbi:MAG: hypothetical protein ACLQIS_18040 [Bryobacteraceae bacterium]
MMVLAMKIASVLLCGLFAFAMGASAQLANVHSVYLLPMAGGLDQDLANRITNAGLFQVVTDPKKADAVFTDRVGTELEAKLAELYPEPPAPKPPAAAAKTSEGANPGEAKEEPAAEAKQAPPPVSTFGKGKGTIFLVDRRSRAVLWSTYVQPKSTMSREMDRTAREIVGRLQRVLKGK